MKPEDLEEGDSILFKGRKRPLKVNEELEDGVIVKGPNGGEYEIYSENDSVLYCRKENRRYSSYFKNLRKVGEWERNGNMWRHSDTGNELKIVKNSIGYWTVVSADLNLESIDEPKYGFNDREVAEKEVDKYLKSNPEG